MWNLWIPEKCEPIYSRYLRYQKFKISWYQKFNMKLFRICWYRGIYFPVVLNCIIHNHFLSGSLQQIITRLHSEERYNIKDITQSLQNRDWKLQNQYPPTALCSHIHPAFSDPKNLVVQNILPHPALSPQPPSAWWWKHWKLWESSHCNIKM